MFLPSGGAGMQTKRKLQEGGDWGGREMGGGLLTGVAQVAGTGPGTG